MLYLFLKDTFNFLFYFFENLLILFCRRFFENLLIMPIPVIVNKKARDAVMCVGWKVSCNKNVLEKLQQGKQCDCPELAKHSKMTALMYSVWQSMQFDPSLEFKLKVSKVCCNFEYGEFYVTCVSPMPKRVFVKMISMIKPNYTYYAANVKLLNGKTNKDEFEYLLSQVGKCSAYVIGKVPEKQAEAITKMQSNLDDRCKVQFLSKAKKVDLGESNNMEMTCKTNHVEVKVSGLNGALTKVYLDSFYESCKHDDVIRVYVEKLDNRAKSSGKIDKFVKQSKSLDMDSLMYVLSKKCLVCPSNIKWTKEKLTNLDKDIKKSLA